jgi:hypothetical protein
MTSLRASERHGECRRVVAFSELLESILDPDRGERVHSADQVGDLAFALRGVRVSMMWGWIGVGHVGHVVHVGHVFAS